MLWLVSSLWLLLLSLLARCVWSTAASAAWWASEPQAAAVGGEEAGEELWPLVEFGGHAGTRSEGKTRRVLLEPERCETLP